MQEQLNYKENKGCGHAGLCFVWWGLWFFIVGIFLGFGVLIHYLVGSSYDNSPYFLSNITLWFGSPLALSSGFLQVGGLGMAIVGGLYMMISKCRTITDTTSTEATSYRTSDLKEHKHTHCCTSLVLCIVGLIALIVTGYIGYYIINYIWPGFYYAPIVAGKNLWLILQGLSILVYFIGIIMATCCLTKCKRGICAKTP